MASNFIGDPPVKTSTCFVFALFTVKGMLKRHPVPEANTRRRLAALRAVVTSFRTGGAAQAEQIPYIVRNARLFVLAL
tara:strand:- start:595 stop:828 length:234 start_codon:yes stop_codon:yes gene_type:complete